MIKFFKTWKIERSLYKYGEFTDFSFVRYYFANDIWIKAESDEEFNKLMKLKAFL